MKGRIVFIGAGVHATTNIYPALIEAGAEIVAVATRSIDRSAAALKRFGSHGRAYDDYQLMLQDEEYDGVVIVTQPADQAGLVLHCLRAGKNVYVDKPLGWNAAEARDIHSVAEEHGCILMVGFMKRYAPIYKQLKDLLLAEDLGKAFSFEAKFAVDSTRFCKTEEQYIKLAAIHYVDLIRFLFGEVECLSGFKNISGGQITQSISFKMAGSNVIGSASFVGMTAYTRGTEYVRVTCADGFIEANSLNSLTVHRSLPPLSGAQNLPWKSLRESDVTFTPAASTMSGCYRDLYLRGFVGEMAHFVDCCVNKTTPVSNGFDNINTMDLCDRILTQLQ